MSDKYCQRCEAPIPPGEIAFAVGEGWVCPPRQAGDCAIRRLEQVPTLKRGDQFWFEDHLCVITGSQSTGFALGETQVHHRHIPTIENVNKEEP